MNPTIALPWLAMKKTLCLASASPRRLELLQQIGLSPQIRPTQIEEIRLVGESPEIFVERMAREKAQAGLGPGIDLSLGADTIVVLDNEILGKPKNPADALRMLSALSGRTHRVLTAIAVWQQPAQTCLTDVVVSHVKMKNASKAEIAAYVATGEPMDKAGSYAIQGVGAFFIQRLEGSYSAVVGLPIYETLELLRKSS